MESLVCKHCGAVFSNGEHWRELVYVNGYPVHYKEACLRRQVAQLRHKIRRLNERIEKLTGMLLEEEGGVQDA